MSQFNHPPTPRPPMIVYFTALTIVIGTADLDLSWKLRHKLASHQVIVSLPKPDLATAQPELVIL